MAAHRFGVPSRTASAVQTAGAAPAGNSSVPWSVRWWAFVDAERESLPLWLPVAFAAGVAAWFLLPWSSQRLGLAVALSGLAGAAVVGRLRPLLVAALLVLAGMAASEWRSRVVAHPVLAGRGVFSIEGRIESVERRAGWGQVRLMIAPDAGGRLPPRVRVTLRGEAPPGLAAGARVRLRAMLSPPAAAPVPGGYDFARRAWFAGVGASGFAMGPAMVVAPARPAWGGLDWLDRVRAALTARIERAVPGESGTVAAALVTGAQGDIPREAAQSMRDSGLAHLLSISGVHIAVVVGGAMWLLRRLLALSPWIALRWPVKAISVGFAALAGVAYTLLAGGEVPTVRSCLATLIVLLGIVIGREAFSLRLLAAAAFVILALRPEALLGPSFQLSFAAVIGIVALYESALGRRLQKASEDENLLQRLLRHGVSLLVSGMVAELALSSIGLYHFNRAGLYGVIANLVAIPFTSFVIMPLLMLSLLADAMGLGGVVYPVLGWSMSVLLGLARWAAGLPGAVLKLPQMPMSAYALIVVGGLWLMLWRSRMRYWGAGLAAIGMVLAFSAQPPDLLVSGDGRHVALLLPDGQLAFLRDRTGNFLRQTWGEATGGPSDGDAVDVTLAELPGTTCSIDACVADIHRSGRRWHLLATRSRDYLEKDGFIAACAQSDIVVSERRLPGWCRPRWLRLDRASLSQSGAIAIWLGTGRIEAVHTAIGDHPWRPAPVPRRWQARPGP